MTGAQRGVPSTLSMSAPNTASAVGAAKCFGCGGAPRPHGHAHTPALEVIAIGLGALSERGGGTVAGT
jgi:hypothetical protein